jgi:hypothetical protein
LKHRWTKLGRLYAPPEHGRHPKLATHAANPLPVHLEGDVYRVFYSGRDAQNRSSVGAVDIDIVHRSVVRDHRDPVFLHGPPGSFFADGVSIGNCYRVGSRRYMLFMGWQAPADGQWRGDIGALEVLPDLSLALACERPWLGADDTDPISLSYPWVSERAAGGYDMWYGSTRAWDAGNGEMLHVLNHATSVDGRAWIRHGLAVPFEIGRAQAFSRPTVARADDGSARIWFSYRSGRGETYRIGCAVDQGSGWRLALDEAGIDVSPDGWDAEMIEYPYVFDHRGERYLLYNGNGYGRTGFGLAVLGDA